MALNSGTTKCSVVTKADLCVVENQQQQQAEGEEAVHINKLIN
jgi:hypothetical protein